VYTPVWRIEVIDTNIQKQPLSEFLMTYPRPPAWLGKIGRHIARSMSGQFRATVKHIGKLMSNMTIELIGSG
jgi:hypothetical protein